MMTAPFASASILHGIKRVRRSDLAAKRLIGTSSFPPPSTLPATSPRARVSSFASDGDVDVQRLARASFRLGGVEPDAGVHQHVLRAQRRGVSPVRPARHARRRVRGHGARRAREVRRARARPRRLRPLARVLRRGRVHGRAVPPVRVPAHAPDPGARRRARARGARSACPRGTAGARPTCPTSPSCTADSTPSGARRPRTRRARTTSSRARASSRTPSACGARTWRTRRAPPGNASIDSTCRRRDGTTRMRTVPHARGERERERPPNERTRRAPPSTNARKRIHFIQHTTTPPPPVGSLAPLPLYRVSERVGSSHAAASELASASAPPAAPNPRSPSLCMASLSAS